MKPHLTIHLNESLSREVPYWEDFILDKHGETTRLTKSTDYLLTERFGLSYWVTANYKKAGSNWSQDERNAGLNRIYRIILRNTSGVPHGLVDTIKLVPEVVDAQEAGIMGTTLPVVARATALTRHIAYRKDTSGLELAHLFTQGSPDIRIAVLDTGFEVDHPEVAHAMLPGKDYVNIIDGANHFVGDFLEMDDFPEDEVGHGTHVAGIIIGRGVKMPIGIAPKCKILPVKVLGALKQGEKTVGAGLVDNINAGIKYAVDEGVDIINMSLGIRNSGGGLPHEDVIRYALSKGVTVVAASGNDGQKDKYYPGALGGVIAVGAADAQGAIAPFSTYGPHVHLTAPGVNIYSSFLQGGYAFSSGTSQAAPMVSGAIGLLKSFASELGGTVNNDRLRYVLQHTSYKQPGQFKDPRAGFGCLHIPDALRMVRHLINKMSYA